MLLKKYYSKKLMKSMTMYPKNHKRNRSYNSVNSFFTSILNTKYNFIFDSDRFSVIFGSSALFTSSLIKLDFVQESFVRNDRVNVSGIASDLKIKGYGTVLLNFCNIRGEVVTLNIEKVL